MPSLDVVAGLLRDVDRVADVRHRACLVLEVEAELRRRDVPVNELAMFFAAARRELTKTPD